MTGHRRRWLVLILAVLTAVAIAAPTLNGRLYGRVVHGDLDGPLEGGYPTTVGQRAEVDQPVTHAILTIDNTRGEPAILEEVRLVPPPSNGFEIIDILVAGPDRPFATIVDLGFPPRDLVGRARPVEGAVVEPQTGPRDRGVLVVVGMRLRRPGFAYYEQIHVDYRLGGRRYTGKYNTRYLVCTPSSFEGCSSELIGQKTS